MHLAPMLLLSACSASTLSSRCLSAIRKGGAAEVASAATALGEQLAAIDSTVQHSLTQQLQFLVGAVLGSC